LQTATEETKEHRLWLLVNSDWTCEDTRKKHV